MPTRLARLLAVAGAALSLAACSYDCGTVGRTVADGVVRDSAGATLATVQADVSEHVGPSYRQLSVGVMGAAASAGAPLRGRVTRARLVSERGDRLAEVPTATGTLYVDAVVALPGRRLTDDEFARVRRELLAGRARVVLETDLPGRARLEAPLTNVRDAPGEVQRCTPT